jgi:AAA+ ATPase superfamily predicted ATPase
MPIEDPNPSTGAVEPPTETSDPIGWFRRKKRAFLGKLVSNLVGENPPPSQADDAPESVSPALPSAGIKADIEENGLFGGIGSRIKRTADQYLQQKLDEIEQRIDRKLDEIDQRLSEWRDREIANRIRILKITLWASVIVAVVSLIYAWLKVYFLA